MAYEKPENFKAASLQILVASVENKEQAQQLRDDYYKWVGLQPLTEYDMTPDEVVKFNIGNTLALKEVKAKKTAGIWKELGIEHPVLGDKLDMPDDVIRNMNKVMRDQIKEGKNIKDAVAEAKKYIAQAEQVIKDGES